MFVNATRKIKVGQHGGFYDEYDEGYSRTIYVDGVKSNTGEKTRIAIEVSKSQLEDLKEEINRFLESEK